jgi:hypothetical protein
MFPSLHSFVWVASLVVVFLSSGSNSSWASQSEETSEKINAEKIKEWVLQLGDDRYDVRVKAEKELARVGVQAKEALRDACKSKDAQVVVSAKRLLGKIKFSTLGEIDYLDIFPTNSFFVARIENISETVKNSPSTALGKLLATQLFSPQGQQLLAKFVTHVNENPNTKKKFELLTKHFKGQIAGAVWKLDINANTPSEVLDAAFLLEVTDGDAAKAIEALTQALAIDEDATTMDVYKDVELTLIPEFVVLGCLGKHILIAFNEESAKEMIDTLLATEVQGFKKSALFEKTQGSLPAKNDLYLALDVETFFKAYAGGLPGLDEVLKTSGLGDFKFAAYTSSIVGDAFEDRFVLFVDKDLTLSPSKIDNGMSAAVLGSSMEALAGVPANATAVVSQNFDGASYAAKMKAYSAARNKMDGVDENGVEVEVKDAFVSFTEELETKWGVNVVEVLSAVKGSVAAWMVMSPNGLAEPPSFGAMLTCADEAKAKAMIESTMQNINKTVGKEAVKTRVWKTHTLYQIDLPVLNDNFTAAHSYASPCFALEGNRVYIATSSQSLQLQLENLDTKVPGLLTNPEFIKATAQWSAAERKGRRVVYVDCKTLLPQALSFFVAEAGGVDEDVKNFLKALSASPELYKDVAPLTISTTAQNDTASITVRSPLPLGPILLGSTVGVEVWNEYLYVNELIEGTDTLEVEGHLAD